jgi:hypothetical protein
MAWFEMKIHLAGKPNSDAIKAAVKNVLQQLDADVYTVQEISDDILFAQMVSEMNDYSYVFRATSHPEVFWTQTSSLFIKIKLLSLYKQSAFTNYSSLL